MQRQLASDHLPDSFEKWPIPAGGRRTMLPFQQTSLFHASLTSKDLYPNAAGFSPAAPSTYFHTGRQLCTTLYYCAAGDGVVQMNGVRTEIGPGDFFVIPRDADKVMESDGKCPWSLYWVRYAGELEKEYTPALTELPRYHIGVDTAVVSEFEAIFHLIRSTSSHSERMEAAAHLKCLIAKIGGIIERNDRAIGIPKLIERIREMMIERIDENLSLAAISSIANLSKFHFSRVFKKHTGTSPVQYFTQLRMEKASELLERSSHPIKRIAAMVGLDDQHYFSRVFRSHMGVSPKGFREQARLRN